MTPDADAVAFNIVKSCTHAMDYQGEEAVACHACIADALTAFAQQQVEEHHQSCFHCKNVQERVAQQVKSLQEKAMALEGVIEAWHSQFGTSQLTHARERLRVAEENVAQQVAQERERCAKIAVAMREASQSLVDGLVAHKGCYQDCFDAWDGHGNEVHEVIERDLANLQKILATP